MMFERGVVALVTVVVLERGNNNRLTQALASLLQPMGPVGLVGDQLLSLPKAAPQLLLYRGSPGMCLQAPHPIVIPAPDLEAPPEIRLPPGARLILSTQIPWAADFASKAGLPVLDCGLSRRDTLTFSSRTQREAVVTLQRPIWDLWGHLVDPVELPLILPQETTPHTLLFWGGICLLCGWAQRMTPQKF